MSIDHSSYVLLWGAIETNTKKALDDTESHRPPATLAQSLVDSWAEGILPEIVPSGYLT